MKVINMTSHSLLKALFSMYVLFSVLASKIMDAILATMTWSVQDLHTEVPLYHTYLSYIGLPQPYHWIRQAR